MRLGWFGRLALIAIPMTLWAAAMACDLPLRSAPWCPAPSDPFLMRIAPLWPSLPLFGVLRSFTVDLGIVDAKAAGLAAATLVFFAPLTLAGFEWRTVPRRAWFVLLGALACLCGLGWCGAQMPTETTATLGVLLTLGYIGVFAVGFPMLARTPKQTPTAVFD